MQKAQQMKTMSIVDGPFTESNETVAGYIFLQVDNCSIVEEGILHAQAEQVQFSTAGFGFGVEHPFAALHNKPSESRVFARVAYFG
jgi:hypothetical protein